MRVTCPKCGAEYDIVEWKTMVRDKDTLDCNYCYEPLIKWNGASFWTIKEEISKPNKPYQISESIS